MDNLQITFLESGKQTGEQVATKLASFLAQATQSIRMALYDIHLSGQAKDIVLEALYERQRAGVNIRICYDIGDNPGRSEELDAQPTSTQTGQFLAATGLPSKAIVSAANLVHHKYIILDAYTPTAQLWTGSTNFTDDSWHLQENNILTIQSPQLVNFYAQDFQELWSTGNIQTTGAMDTGRIELTYNGTPALTTVSFSPGQGRWIDAEVANRISHAQREITIATVVLTSGHILGALGDMMQHGLPINGIYDGTQMDGVLAQWRDNPHASWKTPAFQALVRYGHLVGKPSTPWSATSIHDFMHNKIIVVDDTVITGSYNFSRNAQANAENILLIENAALATTYRNYIRHIAARYGQ